MKAWLLEGLGGLSKIKLGEIADPVAGEGEVALAAVRIVRMRPSAALEERTSKPTDGCPGSALNTYNSTDVPKTIPDNTTVNSVTNVVNTGTIIDAAEQ